MENIELGIVGVGFVGNSVYYTFSPYFKMRLYDKYKPGFEDLETGEEFVGIDVNPEADGPLEHGMLIWMDLDKPPEERHKDDE